MVRSLPNTYWINPSPDYKLVYSLASYHIWFFFKLTRKTALHTVQLQVHYSRVCRTVLLVFSQKETITEYDIHNIDNILKYTVQELWNKFYVNLLKHYANFGNYIFLTFFERLKITKKSKNSIFWVKNRTY